MQKKILIFLLTLLLSCNNLLIRAQENPVTVSVGTVTGKAGETVEINVNLNDCDGFSDLGLEIGYDSDVLTLVEVTDVMEKGAFTTAEYLTANPYNIGWSKASNITYNGHLATLTFEIKENAQPGTYPITVDFYKGRDGNYVDGDSVNYDADFKPLNLVYQNGSITVEKDEAKIEISNLSVGSSVTFDVSLTSPEEITGIVIVAEYDGENRFSKLTTYAASAQIPIIVDSSSAYAKVMWWESISDMRSITTAETVLINQ